MNINPISQNNFKGYDARPLKGFFMNSNCLGISQEMKAIGEIEGFKIFAPQRAKGYQFTCSESMPLYRTDTFDLWAQDKWMVIKNKLLTYDLDNITDALKSFFNLSSDPTQENLRNKMRTPFYRGLSANETRNACHIQGGNVFIVKNNDAEEVIVGKDALKNFSKEEIMQMFDVKKLIALPQMDFHLDLFIRPLDNKRILLTDDYRTLRVLDQGTDKIFKYINEHPKEDSIKLLNIANQIMNIKRELISNMITNNYAQAKEVENILIDAGYDVIKVPGRAYTIVDEYGGQTLQHYCNYINANVLTNNNGELVYITNKGKFDKKLGITPELSKKLGFSFESSFVKTILPYIKKEHIYFVQGEKDAVAEEMLFKNQGGIHCACMEIPKD